MWYKILRFCVTTKNISWNRQQSQKLENIVLNDVDLRSKFYYSSVCLRLYQQTFFCVCGLLISANRMWAEWKLNILFSQIFLLSHSVLILELLSHYGSTGLVFGSDMGRVVQWSMNKIMLFISIRKSSTSAFTLHFMPRILILLYSLLV